MLDYLDSLCAALLARNGTEIRRLLRHPLARALPRRARGRLCYRARRAGEPARARADAPFLPPDAPSSRRPPIQSERGRTDRRR